MEVGEDIYDNFNIYYRSFYDYMDDRPSKHYIIIDLVHIKLPNCNRFYRWLHDECFSARYNNYKVPCEKSNMAIRYLNNIKAHLDKLA